MRSLPGEFRQVDRRNARLAASGSTLTWMQTLRAQHHRGAAVQPQCELQAIDTVNPVEMFGDRACFIALQPADEMPDKIVADRSRDLRQRPPGRGSRRSPFARRRRHRGLFRRLRLGDREEPDRAAGSRPASRADWVSKSRIFRKFSVTLITFCSGCFAILGPAIGPAYGKSGAGATIRTEGEIWPST